MLYVSAEHVHIVPVLTFYICMAVSGAGASSLEHSKSENPIYGANPLSFKSMTILKTY